MLVEFRCKQGAFSDEQKQLITDRLQRLEKYIGEPERAEVYIERLSRPIETGKFKVEATLWLKKHVVRAKACGPDEMAAFDQAEQKLKHRLERLKGRLVARSHPHHRAPKAVDPDQLVESFSITKSKSFELEEMDPESAAFRMELLSHSFYLFINSQTRRAAVVYKRGDGSIGLIDQAEAAQFEPELD
jgi:putative sigma-54 modulation protein